MADEKKPKIDLKARLGKGGAGGSVPVPMPTPVPPGISVGRSAPPAAGSSPPAMPPGVPVGPPPRFSGQPSPVIDPSNPLAAVAAPYRPAAVVQASQHMAATRIEVDEGAIHEARKGANKRGMVVALILGVAGVAVGFVAGGASEQGKARDKSKGDAQSLNEDLVKAKDVLTKLADKMEEGRTALTTAHKFPDTLSKDLGGLNVAFDGSELAGRRFSGFPTDTTSQLVDFVMSVQALNDKKMLIEGLLNKLQKPLTEQLSAPAGQTTISQVMVVTKDPQNGVMGLLANLTTPIKANAGDVKLPAEFAFTDPLGNGNASLARYTGGDISAKPAAIAIVPKTFANVCPSEASGQATQLAAQIGGFIRDIKGEGPAQTDVVTDSKAGLLERADKLMTGLQKVQ
jgi:hypothetical protein